MKALGLLHDCTTSPINRFAALVFIDLGTKTEVVKGQWLPSSGRMLMVTVAGWISSDILFAVLSCFRTFGAVLNYLMVYMHVFSFML